MKSEVKLTHKKFILVGLGLGYHLDYLIENIEDVEVQYILLDEQEMKIYLENNNKNHLKLTNVKKFNALQKKS
ncbi:hypothetical protein [Kurthia sp. Dielmo]|uniref:hypothetical protein n=1 Tax=Kurthia sp. Dielmo TaxID=1033738 RepID=UPI00030C0748|nr:hypothetical protein [Kurthia sp. Dielmo]